MRFVGEKQLEWHNLAQTLLENQAIGGQNSQ